MSTDFEERILEKLLNTGVSSPLMLMLDHVDVGIILVRWPCTKIQFANKFAINQSLAGAPNPNWVGQKLIDDTLDPDLYEAMTASDFVDFNKTIKAGDRYYQVKGQALPKADNSDGFISLFYHDQTQQQIIATEMKGVMDRMFTETSSIRNDAEGLMDSTQQVMIMSGGMAGQSDQVATTVRNVAGATGSLNRSISSISSQFEIVGSILGEADERASRAASLVMALEKASLNISAVVKLIDDIASRTNLLALNATIEAARAGEAGRGFAVVAGEVKSLSGQTKEATHGIAENINAIKSSTEDVVQIIDLLKQSMDKVSETVAEANQSTMQQTGAVQEISDQIASAVDVTNQVSESMGKIQGDAEFSGSAAQHMFKSLREMVRLTEEMREDMVVLFDDMAGEVTDIRALREGKAPVAAIASLNGGGTTMTTASTASAASAAAFAPALEDDEDDMELF